MIQIFNEDCIVTMKEHIEERSVDIVLTSPPYNNSRTSHTDYCMETRNCRYALYDDNKPNDEYCQWICDIFMGYDKVLKPNGVVLFNISYGSENPTVMFECINDICRKTPFMIADVITWKKRSALPNNVSPNKCTRICEYVYVFCRKNEYDTFKTAKTVKSYSRTGQAFYSANLFNFIEADNNDGTNELNNATFSSELVYKLLEMYLPNDIDKKDILVYDNFMGTGTTAFVCGKLGINCYGSEIDPEQVEYAMDRINGIKNNSIQDKDFERFEWDI